MRVLLLLSESWNDILHPNNNMTNWFLNCPNVEIWTISGSSVRPCNSISSHYFLVDESKMAKSILSRKRVGSIIEDSVNSSDADISLYVKKTKKIKKIFSSEIVRLLRDCVWRFGVYDEELLKDFIHRSQPDIVFSQRKGSVKMCRLESLVMKYTSAPLVVYTGDDDFSLKQFNLNPIFWIRLFWTRKWIRKTAPCYKLLYSQSERQMNEYKEVFGVPTKFLVKSGHFKSNNIRSVFGSPIQLVYAGKLYCNRWKTLSLITKSIREVNENANEIKIQLNIYTPDFVSKKQHLLLDDGEHSIIHPAVSSDELKEVYSQSDLLIHVEGLDLRNKLLTKDSFSTKVMDCLSSGSAVLVVAWKEHSALKYLRQNEAALTACSYNEVRSIVNSIVSDPQILLKYAQSAYNCGISHHQKEDIQASLLNDFSNVIANHKR